MDSSTSISEIEQSSLVPASEDFFLFSVLYHCKKNITGFGVGQCLSIEPTSS